MQDRQVSRRYDGSPDAPWLERAPAPSARADVAIATGGALRGALAEDLLRQIEGSEAGLGGTQIGPYRLLREIGRGGMAVVFEAERADGIFQQRVALKLMKRGLDTDEVLRRFQREREILAALNHPGIAHLLDGGAAGDGRPYFAMELVQGLPIDRFCADHGLSVSERLDLFVSVARAVQYAHRALVVHRDLKPSNILITADREIKLLDFGIAKLLEPGAEPHVPPTRTSLRVMTPEYASPEQLRGDPITAAVDVYQLGLLLYELLTGTRAQQLAGLSQADAARVICEADPPRPSAVVRARAETGNRQSGAARLARVCVRHARPFGAELDDIVLRALRKEPENRYGSVEQLVSDVVRYQRGLPVLARGTSLRYRSRKFLKRHAVAIATAAVIVATLAFYNVRLASERDRAQREAEAARSVAAFVTGLFQQLDPSRSNAGNVTARELLDRGAERIARDLAGQPLMQAEMLTVVGQIYINLGLHAQAAPLLERAVQLRGEHLDAADPQIAQSLHALATAYDGLARYDESRRLFEDALRLRQAAFGDRHEAVAATLNQLALVEKHTGRLEDARRLHQRALAIQEAALGPSHEVVATSLNNLGLVEQVLGNHSQSRELFARSLAIHQQNHGAEHPYVVSSLHNLAEAYRYEKNHAAARPLLERVVAVTRKVYGPNHATVATAINSLANLLNDSGAYAEAAPLYEEAIAIYERTLGANHPNTAYPIRNLGNLHRATGAYREALTQYERALAIRTRAYGRVHPQVAQTLESVGSAKLLLADLRGAETALSEALAIARQTLPADHASVGDISSGLGWCLAETGRLAEAEPLLANGYRILAMRRGDTDPFTQSALQRLVALYERRGEPEEAARHRERLRPAA